MEQDITKPLELPGPYLRMYTIYDHPTDYPNHFVVRGITIREGHIIHDHIATAIVDTLREARAAIPMQYSARISRSPEDEPQIVETWL